MTWVTEHDVYHMGIHPYEGQFGPHQHSADEILRDARSVFGLIILDEVRSPAGICTTVRGRYFSVCAFISWLYGADYDGDTSDDEGFLLDALPHALDDPLAFVE